MGFFCLSVEVNVFCCCTLLRRTDKKKIPGPFPGLIPRTVGSRWIKITDWRKKSKRWRSTIGRCRCSCCCCCCCSCCCCDGAPQPEIVFVDLGHEIIPRDATWSCWSHFFLGRDMELLKWGASENVRVNLYHRRTPHLDTRVLRFLEPLAQERLDFFPAWLVHPGRPSATVALHALRSGAPEPNDSLAFKLNGIVVVLVSDAGSERTHIRAFPKTWVLRVSGFLWYVSC